MEKRLGELLIEDRIVSAHDLELALRRQTETGLSLGRLLIDMGKASEWEVAATLGKQLNVPFITLSHYEIDPEVLESIPEELVHKYRIVPVDKTGDTLTIALADPSNIYLLDELKLLTHCQIIPVISFESDIKEAILKYYPDRKEDNFEEALKDITDQDIAGAEKKVTIEDESPDENGDDLSLQADDAPVVQLVNLMISEALKMRASDIHIEPYERSLRLRYRVDGVLQEMAPPPKKFQNAIISRIKILSDLDIAEKRLPQDGRFKVRIQNRSVDFRVSSCPIANGEKVVIRILEQSNLQRLTDLGFEPQILDKFEREIRKPWGMILVTGPTGSGKSTTLYSALNTINDPTKNIMTIEDPVEYQLLGINQVQARPDIGLTFADGLKSFLRQDPDIIMVGEIRDLETAEIGVKAALTGHLVLSTLHTNDAPSSINRLTNMGVEPFMVTASLNMIVAQRLVRRICLECRQEVIPTPEVLASVGIEPREGAVFFQGSGCGNCNGTGFRGRVALYEVLVMDEDLRDAVIMGAPTNKIKKMAIASGMETLRVAGQHKIFEGRTTIGEVVTATVADTFKETDK
ncbi:MAG: Flp pilus assembly complex ATPase component TadA [bacterium]|nr:Flp pilus assembly complex ATPase component TadA [bacterium]